jgi:hypothetical protein
MKLKLLEGICHAHFGLPKNRTLCSIGTRDTINIERGMMVNFISPGALPLYALILSARFIYFSFSASN